ncbi:MAG: barstar family protein [Betaproteobacteria bacterium]|nr:barstar family protein [Betaproteobacteria bacterium]
MSAMSQKLQKLLAQNPLAGIYHLPHSDCKALKQAALAARFGWLQTDFGDSREIAAILKKIGKDLRLPDWYGANYDALADCLTDLSWNTAPGYVLLISGADEIHARDSAAFDTLNEVLAGVIENWQEANIPFWVFYDGRPNGLAPLPTLTPQ